MPHSTDIVDQPAPGFAAKLIAPVAIAGVLSLAAVLALIWVAARGQDDVAASSSSDLMDAVLDSMREDLAKTVFDQSWWDSALENLIEVPDPIWASDNVGDYAAEVFNIKTTFVVSSTNQTLFAFRDAVPSRDDVFDYFGAEIGQLTESARRAPMAEPIPVTAFLPHGDMVHLVAVSALTPENPTEAQFAYRTRPVLIHSQDMSRARLDYLSERYGFVDLAITPVMPPEGADRVSAPLLNASGEPVGWIGWTPPHPGSTLFAQVLPWLVAGILILLVLAYVFIGRVVAVAREAAADAVSLAEKDRQLAQTSKLAVLGEMAAGVVHELNQPLNIIRMATDTTRESLRGGSRDPLPEQIDKQLSVIGGQTRRMAETIQSMRVFSRDDYGRKIAFDPVRATNQALSWLRPELAERGIGVSLQAPVQCGRIYGEPSRFEQVIVNLILNARDAVQTHHKNEDIASGEISLVISEDMAGEIVEIEVRDNGGGVPEEYIERLFEPFFTTKSPGDGTGLGLSISYGIVGGMNGSLSVSNRDQGAVFRIELPRLASANENERSRSPDAAS